MFLCIEWWILCVTWILSLFLEVFHYLCCYVGWYHAEKSKEIFAVHRVRNLTSSATESGE